uniref:Putative eukaryotic translation initiation factor 4e transporter-like protein n=1 Tax=Lutzomyia longipalpis TaxID=7200 RepID=A0A7G3AJT2_LUTLO
MSESVSDVGAEDADCMAPDVESDSGSDAAKGHHIRYTLEELMTLGELPLSRRRPECYDDTPPPSNAIRIPWRRPADPPRPEDDKLTRLDKRRERVRKFQEIVLSPQRRSFNMGCHMPPPPSQPAAPLVPAFGRDRDGGRDRRIGSGRIVTRDVSWDYKPPDSSETESSYSYRNGAPTYMPPRPERDNSATRDEWMERRPFPQRNSTSSFDSNRGRGGAVRRGYRDFEAEPEWFSSGPTSQFDTIELKGFEEAAQASEEQQPQQPQAPSQPPQEEVEVKTEEVPSKAATPPPDTNNNAPAEKDVAREFNFDEYFHLDADFLSDHTRPPDGAGSRFSQWFSRRSPDAMPQAVAAADVFDSRRSSIIDELENIMNDSLSPEPSDGNSNKYFTPISPANGGGEVPKSVMDFLHTANMGSTTGLPPGPPPVKHNPQKILNVKEIEASMRECGFPERPPQPPPQGRPPQRPPMRFEAAPAQPKEKPEMDVFRKFVANMPNEQLVGGKGPPAPPPDDKAKKQFNAGPRGGRTTASTYLELVQKVIYHGATQTNRQELLNTPEAREFLRGLVRGELSIHNLLRHLRVAMPGREQEIIVAVLWHFDKTSRAEVAAQLMQQPPPPRPIIQQQQPHSPNLAPDPAPHLTVFPAATQPPPTGVAPKLSVSPLPNAMPQRIPSPRELQFHTQSIMQNALIRKKLEEQLENYRKRQEMAQQQMAPEQASPARRLKPQHQAAPSPTPLAFTPTSVLRKMTADKDMEPPQVKDTARMVAPSVQVPKGRAIVKGGQQMMYASNIEMQQMQQYQAQQQQQQQQRPRATPPIPPQMGMAPGGGAFANFAQQHFMQQQRPQRPPRHQFDFMRAAPRPPGDIHPRPRDDQQQPPHAFCPFPGDQRSMLNFGRDGNMSPTSNQLARWFSPELLAQASAGKLPSLGVGQALSLEEFERNIQHSSTTVHN